MKRLPQNSPKQSQAELLSSLRTQLAALENTTVHRSTERISSGCNALDDMLPGGGFQPGQLVEWLVDRTGHGCSTLALMVACNATHNTQHSSLSRKALVVIDRPQTSRLHSGQVSEAAFYPPAAAGLGISLHQLIVLRPNSVADEIWALDQVLRCPSVGAVWAWLPKLGDRDFRRLQLAAETGGSLGLFIRPARLRGQPTWADIQLLVEARPSTATVMRPVARRTKAYAPHSSCPSPLRRRWKVTLSRCRGGTAGAQRLLELDETNGTISEVSSDQLNSATFLKAPKHETNPLPLAAQLARPTNRPKPSRKNSA